MNALQNKVIWITGASSGIGEALVYEFAKQQAIVVVSARREQELQRVITKANFNTTNFLIIPFDLSDTSQVQNQQINNKLRTTCCFAIFQTSKTKKTKKT